MSFTAAMLGLLPSLTINLLPTKVTNLLPIILLVVLSEISSVPHCLLTFISVCLGIGKHSYTRVYELICLKWGGIEAVALSPQCFGVANHGLLDHTSGIVTFVGWRRGWLAPCHAKNCFGTYLMPYCWELTLIMYLTLLKVTTDFSGGNVLIFVIVFSPTNYTGVAVDSITMMGFSDQLNFIFSTTSNCLAVDTFFAPNLEYQLSEFCVCLPTVGELYFSYFYLLISRQCQLYHPLGHVNATLDPGCQSLTLSILTLWHMNDSVSHRLTFTPVLVASDGPPLMVVHGRICSSTGLCNLSTTNYFCVLIIGYQSLAPPIEKIYSSKISALPTLLYLYWRVFQ